MRQPLCACVALGSAVRAAQSPAGTAGVLALCAAGAACVAALTVRLLHAQQARQHAAGPPPAGAPAPPAAAAHAAQHAARPAAGPPPAGALLADGYRHVRCAVPVLLARAWPSAAPASVMRAGSAARRAACGQAAARRS